MLECMWDNTSKLPKKYKFQGQHNKTFELHINSGTYGIEFFLKKTLPQFNWAGACLNWSWLELFSEFENVLGDTWKTSWFEVLHDNFPEPLEGKAATPEANHNVRKNFYHAIDLFIKKVLDEKNPQDLQCWLP